MRRDGSAKVRAVTRAIGDGRGGARRRRAGAKRGRLRRGGMIWRLEHGGRARTKRAREATEARRRRGTDDERARAVIGERR